MVGIGSPEARKRRRPQVALLAVAALASLVAVVQVPARVAEAANHCDRSDTERFYDTNTPPIDAPLDPMLGGTTVTDRAVNDPLYPMQWYLAAVRAPEAWKHGARGQGQVIAIIDSGVDPYHPDLKDKLLPNPDGHFYAPGPSPDCPQDDPTGHGTGVAGVAAASTDNGIGIAGTAPDAKILAISWPSDRGLAAEAKYQFVEGFANGIRYAVDRGADVINISAGLPTKLDWEVAPGAERQPGLMLEQALEYAERAGVVVVSIAHNLAGPGCQYPGSDPRVICVGTFDRRGNPAWSTNRPYKEEGVGVVAPGSADNLIAAPQGRGCHRFADSVGPLYVQEAIWQTMHPIRTRGQCALYRGYGPANGTTSISAPIVSGIAAMLTARNLSPADVRACLVATSSNNGVNDRITGYGKVDALRAVRECRPDMAKAG